MTIVWSTAAVEDLTHLRNHITQHDPIVAARVAGAILDAVENLELYPSMGRPGRVPHTRELVIPNTPYVVPYTITEDIVEIIAVIHSARKWPDENNR